MNPREAAKRAALEMMASGDPWLERRGHALFAELLGEGGAGQGASVSELAAERSKRGGK